MEIRLHPDIERFLREQVAAGGYDSAGEVVTEALFLLWQREYGSDASPGRPEIAPPRPATGRPSIRR